MRTNLNNFGPTRRLRAMTLVEMMTTLGLFTLMVAALVTVNMFGLKQDELTNSKLGASDQTRMAFNLLLDEIRAAKNVQIGAGTSTNFVPITNGPQAGDTIQIILSTNTNYLVYYYFTAITPPKELAANCNWLVRVSSYLGSSPVTNVVARNICNVTNQWMTNVLNFSALGLNGTNWTLLTNDPAIVNNRNYVVNALLQFYQYQYPLTKVGSNYLYDYYQLNLQAARRSIN